MMAMESSYRSRLIDLILEMASLFLSRRQNAPSSLPPPLCRSIGKRTILRAHRFSHQSLSPSSGQNKSQNTTSSQRHRRHQHLSWLSRTFPSPSSPPLSNRCAACDIHGAPPPGRRSGTRCSAHLVRPARRQRCTNRTRIRPSSAAAIRMLTGAARGRGWPRSRTARRTTKGTCSWTRSWGLMR
ncbi:hypothetical protein EDB86DRAFT_1000137 [Lactarius hatsudake]|nr:hypothetical protein EDB86DRAFT_1000137 [Lactarius hatsudake]